MEKKKSIWSWIRKKMGANRFRDDSDIWRTSSSPTSDSSKVNNVPKPYTFVKELGSGKYGDVIQCRKPGSDRDVVVKIAKRNMSSIQMREARILENLMQHNLDKINIVKYLGIIHAKSAVFGLEFEALDMNLHEFHRKLGCHPQLEVIRTIIQQLAVALEGLKKVGVIHTDIKTDNIMFVDHINQPLKVKLIDFGLAVYSKDTKPGDVLQPVSHRAPEVLLKLPVSEAIDVWSLGVVMANVLLGTSIFPALSELETMKFITDMLGPPPQDLVDASPVIDQYFEMGPCGWVPKKKFALILRVSDPRKRYKFKNLDEMKMVRREKDNPTEADDRRECIELLKAMLTWDAKDRITPEGILNHPFITRSYLKKPALCCDLQGITKLPPGVILVKPAAPENRHSVVKSIEDPAGHAGNPCRDPKDMDMEESPECAHAETSCRRTKACSKGCSPEAVPHSSEPPRDQKEPPILTSRLKKKNPLQRCWSWIKGKVGSVWFEFMCQIRSSKTVTNGFFNSTLSLMAILHHIYFK